MLSWHVFGALRLYYPWWVEFFPVVSCQAVSIQLTVDHGDSMLDGMVLQNLTYVVQGQHDRYLVLTVLGILLLYTASQGAPWRQRVVG